MLALQRVVGNGEDVANRATTGDEFDAQVENQPGRGEAFSRHSERLQAVFLASSPQPRRQTRKQKRQLRSGGTTLVHETDVYRIVRLMPHAGITSKKIKQRYLPKPSARAGGQKSLQG